MIADRKHEGRANVRLSSLTNGPYGVAARRIPLLAEERGGRLGSAPSRPRQPRPMPDRPPCFTPLRLKVDYASGAARYGRFEDCGLARMSETKLVSQQP